jgi:protein-tyrosine phosphatase
VSGFVDIHAHVLPGIDDGPRELEQSLELIRAAQASGIVTLAVTPHLHPDFPAVRVEELAGRLDEVRQAAESEGLEVALVGGAEVSLSWALEADAGQLRLASFGQRGRDLLIETPASGLEALEHLLYQLRVDGYRITLAHPERTQGSGRELAQLERLVEQGVLLQVNAESLLGSGTTSLIRKLARLLCRRGLAHALASDAHRADRWRPVGRLALGAQALSQLVGEERAAWMTQQAPAAILAGEPVSPAPAERARSLRLAVWRR